jgi:hypothetical protein
MSDFKLSRRHFFYGTLLTGAIPAGGFGSVASLKTLGYKSPNEKLNLASIGCGNQPFLDIVNAEADVENVVALADCDWERGQQGFVTYPKAAKYKDFRKMLDKSGKDIDAVIVGTPDHMHATCALWCMQAGKHVYVEKPLTRTAWEARLLTQAAAKYKVATQMGNQGYSHDATRVACEIFWSGEIGEVREVHAWTGIGMSPQGMTKIPPPTPVPETLDWDLWLGMSAYRPFTKGDQEYLDFCAKRNFMTVRGVGSGMPDMGDMEGFGPGGIPRSVMNMAKYEGDFYMPFNWRGHYDFGTSNIGDWGIHILGPANWALQLHPRYLISVECVSKDPLPPFTYPDELTLKYEFGERPGMPPVTINWYHKRGGDAYLPPGMTVEQARKIQGKGPQVGPAGRGNSAGAVTGGAIAQGGAARGGRGETPAGATGGEGGTPSFLSMMNQGSGYNCIFAGSKGYMGTAGRGEEVGLLPGSRWAEYKLPAAYLPRSPGASTGDNAGAHARDWVRACKGGAPACSNFSVAGPYAEWMILGLAAIHGEGKLLWNNAKGEFSNNKEANKWVKPAFRKGWEIKL